MCLLAVVGIERTLPPPPRVDPDLRLSSQQCSATFLQKSKESSFDLGVVLLIVLLLKMIDDSPDQRQWTTLMRYPR